MVSNALEYINTVRDEKGIARLKKSFFMWFIKYMTM